MMLTQSTAKRIEQISKGLHEEFPQAPLQMIEHDIEDRVRELKVGAHFDDFISLLAWRAVRERLQARNWN
jgi:hypothetical protein